MSNDKKTQTDSETILITLDQIGQTIEVMTNVVGRLRGYIIEQTDTPSPTNNSDDFDIPLPHAKQSQAVH